jgi:hypothetical protein
MVGIARRPLTADAHPGEVDGVDEVRRVRRVRDLHGPAGRKRAERVGKVPRARRVLVELGLLDRQEQRRALSGHLLVARGGAHLREVFERGDYEGSLKTVALAAQIGHMPLLASAQNDAWRSDGKLRVDRLKLYLRARDVPPHVILEVLCESVERRTVRVRNDVSVFFTCLFEQLAQLFVGCAALLGDGGKQAGQDAALPLSRLLRGVPQARNEHKLETLRESVAPDGAGREEAFRVVLAGLALVGVLHLPGLHLGVRVGHASLRREPQLGPRLGQLVVRRSTGYPGFFADLVKHRRSQPLACQSQRTVLPAPPQHHLLAGAVRAENRPVRGR